VFGIAKILILVENRKSKVEIPVYFRNIKKRRKKRKIPYYNMK